MRKYLLLALLFMSGSAFAGAKLAHYWDFNEFGVFSRPTSLADTLPYDPDGIWTLDLKKMGQDGAYQPNMVMPASDIKLNTLGYGAAYGNFYHVGAPNGSFGNNYAYLSCQGTILDFKKAWSYTITSWVRPDVTGSMVLFSIGMAGEGFQLIYNSVTNALTFNLHGVQADFGSMNMGAAIGGDSDFRHIGFSMDNDGKGNMTVNYYLNGEKFFGGTASVASMIGETINGFNVGADGTNGGLAGSCNYDDIKIFTGVLDEAEIKEAMKPGTGNFVIDDPTIPEPATPLLVCLGSAFLLRRRRPVQ